MWVERCRDTKTVDDLPEKGEMRATSSKEDKMIVALFKRNPTLRLREAKTKLVEKGLHVIINTIRRWLAEAKVQYRPTRQKPLLSEVHMEKRLAWATENIDRDWSNVLFSDKASSWAWVLIKRAWSAAGERFLQWTIKHPITIHVWRCFSLRGFGCLEIFTDNLNAQKMLQIYKHGLLRFAEKMFRANNKDWILQEDNDPKHLSHLCTSWKAKNGITTFDWPSQSPDENPIENVWNVVKRKLARRRAFTLKQLSRRIKEVWRSLPTE